MPRCLKWEGYQQPPHLFFDTWSETLKWEKEQIEALMATPGVYFSHAYVQAAYGGSGERRYYHFCTHRHAVHYTLCVDWYDEREGPIPPLSEVKGPRMKDLERTCQCPECIAMREYHASAPYLRLRQLELSFEERAFAPMEGMV